MAFFSSKSLEICGNRKRKKQEEADPQEKKTKLNESWRNLDLILSLENNHRDATKNAEIQRKNIALAFDFVTAGFDTDHRWPKSPVPTSRLASVMGSWIQSVMIFSENSSDYRCWVVFEFCLKNSVFGVHDRILQAFAGALRKDGDNGGSSVDFFNTVSGCLDLILSSNPRAFSNANKDSWLICAVEVAGVMCRIFAAGSYGSGEVLGRMSGLLLEHFVSFLRFRPNPRDIFPEFVNRLLEPLLELLVLLHERGKDENFIEVGGFLERIEDVLSNGLFHPAHIGGFFSFKGLNSEQKARGSKDQKSYHKHLFEKLRKFILEKKGKALEGFGYLFHLFVISARAQKGPSLGQKGERSLRKGNEVSEEGQETNKPLFEVFVQFMRPLLLDGDAENVFDELKKVSENLNVVPDDGANHILNELGKISEDSLNGAHCILKSVNVILSSFIQENIYVRTEDTSEGAQFSFLKVAYDAVVSISDKTYMLWSSMVHMDDGRERIMLPLIAREVIATMTNFLEIEYKLVEDDLVNLWLMMFSYMAVYISLEDTEPSPLLASEISRFGCKLINVYSELRQVNVPLFALCKAVRLLGSAGDAAAAGYSKFNSFPAFSSHIYLKSMGSWLCSHELQLSISDAIKSIPEGQASGCIQELRTDIIDTLQWIRLPSLRQDDEKCSIGTDNTFSCFQVLDMQTELLGNFFSEIYTIVLDSLSITATNSILIGNSIKDMMTTIGGSFSDLVRTQSGNVEESIFSVTGRRLYNHGMPESDCGIWPNLAGVSWVYVFFFRMYVACRSLYRQTISLMPPKLSRKASESMGNFFVVATEVDWREKPEFMDEGYFSWIVKPSISLPDVIKYLTKDVLLISSTVCAPLVYIVHVMALQRLNDLNRLISSFEFLLGRGKHKSRKQVKNLIAVSRKEAAELTNFMIRHIKLSDYDAFFLSGWNDGTVEANPVYHDAWDLGVCSLNEKSLNIAIWRLLCQNIDIWCAHATDKQLKNFLSFMFLFSIPRGCTSRDVGEKCKEEHCYQKVTMHCISLEFLTSTVSYEQTILLKHFTSRFCRVLKKLLYPILSHPCVNIDLGSLPDWSEFMKILEKEPLSGMDYMTALPDPLLSQSEGVHLNMQYSENDKRQACFLHSLESCESLLNLLCRMPKVHVNCKSFSIYVTYVLNLERLVLSSLLKNQVESFICSRYKLLRLFISCRRAIKLLVRASFEENFGAEVSSVCVGFDCSSSFLWLLKSVHAIAGLPHTFFGESYNQVQDLIFSLVDNTSCIFWALSEGQMNAIRFFPMNDGKIHTGPPVDDDSTENHMLVEPNGHSKSPIYIESEKYLGPMDEILQEETRKLLVSLKASVRAVRLEPHFRDLGCSKLSSTISCFQGFIWGLIPALDSMCRDCSTVNSQCTQLIPGLISKLGNCIAVFGDLINLCLHILSLDDRKESEVHDTVENFEKLHDLVISPSLDLLAFSAKKFSRSKFEHSSKTHPSTGEQDARPDCLTCEHADNIDSPSGCVHSQSSRLKKKKKLSFLHANYLGNVIDAVHNMDLSKLQNLEGSLIQSLLKAEVPQIAFTVRQLFSAAAALLKLKETMLSFPGAAGSEIHNCQFGSSTMIVLLQTSQLLLRKMSEEDGRPDPFSFIWLDGILTFLEVVGSMFRFTDRNLSKDAYAQLINTHLMSIGKCISLQGRGATLSSHETGSNTKMLYYQRSSRNDVQLIGHRNFDVNAFKARLRMSFKRFIRNPSKLLLKTALKSIERALVGAQRGCNVFYEIETGNLDGGEISSIVAAGIDCLDSVLESASGFPAGNKHVLEKIVLSLVGALFNIVLHIRNPNIFYLEKPLHYESGAKPDAGSVVLMCIEILTKVAGSHSFPMDPCHVSQCLQIPLTLFEDFRQLRDSHVSYVYSESTDNQKKASSRNIHHIIDPQFSVELYASCCRLLCSTLKHRNSEADRCIAMLEDSVSTLLNCLEMVDADLYKGKFYCGWGIKEAAKCASFFRRIYEEIRQQRVIFGKYSIYFLSNYISTYSGYGPLKMGIKKEVDEALRPGVYSLIDMCTEADCQQLHTFLGEGPCRNTLKTLLQDYKVHFQYSGKI